MNDLSRLFLTVADAIASRNTVLLLSDFDGTLSWLVDHRDEAWLAREVRENLRDLARAPRVHVGVVSGRALSDLRDRVRLPELIYAGCHGLQIAGPGFHFTHAEADARRGELAEIAQDLGRTLGATPGVVVEVKGLCVAVHYRHVVGGDIARVEHELEAVMGSRPAFALLPGKKVFDIVPAVAWDKGQCVRYIRDHIPCEASRGITVMYLGDDTSDEIAFRVLGAEALTVRVGEEGGNGSARYRLRDVSDVHCLIALLAEDVVSRNAGHA
jgi:alpha,alpha-trehalase